MLIKAASHDDDGDLGASSFRLLPLPRPLAVLTRDEGDQASAGQRSHLEITRRRQEVVRVDSAHFLRGRQFPQLASRWSRRHWWRYRLGSARKPRPDRRPEWFPVRHLGTARCARPAAAVYPLTDRASPDCAHPGGGLVRFRTSFPTRRPARRGSVAGDRGRVGLRPLPRRAPDGGGVTSSCVTGRMAIRVACT
jgi:hypothetical protein